MPQPEGQGFCKVFQTAASPVPADPRIIDMQLVDTELLVDIGLSHRLPVNVMGDGMRKLISIILSVYSCKDGVLMIDEVDNGFHYTTMPLL